MLAFAYKLLLLDSQQFNDHDEIYLRLKNKFLRTYFGDSQIINRFAEELILEGQMQAAIELNDHVRVLGKSLISDKVIDELGRKYRIKRVIAEQKTLEIEKNFKKTLREIFIGDF